MTPISSDQKTQDFNQKLNDLVVHHLLSCNGKLEGKMETLEHLTVDDLLRVILESYGDAFSVLMLCFDLTTKIHRDSLEGNSWVLHIHASAFKNKLSDLDSD